MNYQITLDKDENHKKVFHPNHLIEYFPIEEKIVDQTTNYGLTNDDKKTFYSKPQNSQTQTLDSGFSDVTFPSRILTPSPTLPHRPRGRTSIP